MRRVLDWLHARTGYRHGLSAALDEPLPSGTGWLFTLGSVLLFLLVVQILSGAVLALYYAPTPDHAHDSVRFITEAVPLGWLVRGLHYFGASALVIVAVLHLLRVVALGSYKAPRELTWVSGVVMFLLILAFALTGYLLPWDQRAYWATVVTINIAKLTPLAGEQMAALLSGGAEIGALTLTRWYGLHVLFLPGALVLLVVGHLYLMRRHGISGPVRTRPGPPHPFYPAHAVRDVTVIAVVAVVLVVLAARGMPALEPIADPSDATYVPRPEWYFLPLFELLKYFPGRWELVGAIVLPGAAVTVLLLLPWLDRHPERDPRRRPIVMGATLLALISVATLTTLGLRDLPAGNRNAGWAPRVLAGAAWAADANCARCHNDAGIADELPVQPMVRGRDWLAGHVNDPEVIAPGLRPPPSERHEQQVRAIVAYVQRLREGSLPQQPDASTVRAAQVFARYCVVCHTIDGDGGADGPELSRIGQKHERDWLRRWIEDPTAVREDADMPAFGGKLTPEELDSIASYLALRR